MAQDDYYYEIQLSNKQLVFYFMAGATGLILSFLAGVMVGRGVDSAAGEVQAARTVQEDRIVAEETPRPARPATEDLTYAQRLEGEKVDDRLERPRAGGKVTAVKPVAVVGKATPPLKTAPAPTAAVKTGPGSPLSGTPATTAAKVPPPGASPAPTRIVSAMPSPAAPTAAVAPPAETGGGFTIQVGVFKEKARADALAARLKTKGFAPNVTGAPDGPFSVRVGSYADRADAERAQARLRDEEKLQPFIVKK